MYRDNGRYRNFTRRAAMLAGGQLLARWRRLVIGVELLDGRRSIRLRDVEAWFDRGGEAVPAD